MSERGASLALRIVVSLALAGAVGCQNELFSDSMTPHTASPGRLREVGTFDPVKESAVPARSLAEASKDLAADRLPGQKAPPMREMTLADCRALALERNLDLRVQLFSPSIAEAAVGVEMAKFETSIFARYNRNDQNVVTNALTGDGLAQDTATLGLTAPLATGGTLNLSGQSIIANQDLVGSVLPGTQDNQGGLEFSISQPLLRGAGIEANTASIRVAKLTSQIADARTKLEAIRVLANVDRAYWNLYSATRELEVRQQQYELAVVQLELARRLVKAGQTAEVEIIRAESGVGSRLEAIIVADNAVRLRQRDLKRIMNDPELPLDGTTYVATKTLPSPVSLQFDPETMSTKAIENRMEMLELELQLSIDANNIDLARNQALPLFTVDYVYDYFGYGTSMSQAWSSLGDAAVDPTGSAERDGQPRECVAAHPGRTVGDGAGRTHVRGREAAIRRGSANQHRRARRSRTAGRRAEPRGARAGHLADLAGGPCVRDWHAAWAGANRLERGAADTQRARGGAGHGRMGLQRERRGGQSAGSC
jgi:outer membrane protein TolC